MSKVQFVKPNSIRVTTDLTQEQINTAKLLAPKSLSIFEEETENFRLGFGNGSVSKYGVTVDSDSMAVATLPMAIDSLEAKVFAHQIKTNLDIIETQVTTAIESFNSLADIEVL